MKFRVRPGPALVAALAGLHSLAVGTAMLLVPALVVRLGQWAPRPDLFFVRQGGAFHLVLGLAYLLEWRSHRRLRLLVLAKSCAVVFLGASLAAGAPPVPVLLALAGDAGLLAAGILAERALPPNS